MSKRNFITFALILSIVWFPCRSFAGQFADEVGRRLTISHIPTRIISLAPGITETLYALNLEDRIVGVTSFCNWPAAAIHKPKVGGFVNPAIERIVSLKPDLIIATADGNKQNIVRQLEKIGLTVYVTNPTDTNGILTSIRHLGEITGAEKSASELVGRLKKRLNHVTTQTSRKIKPRIFFQIGFEPVITVGRGTLIDETIELAGGINIAHSSAARYPRYSAEGIMAASPDIVLFAPMASDKEFTAAKEFWRKLPEIPAVKNNRIYPIDTDLIGRASPRIIDAIEQMALIFHPGMHLAR